MSPRGVRLLLGPDRARKLQRVHELERLLTIHPLDRHQLHAAQLPSDDLLALCRQQPAAGSARLVVVDDAHRLDRACVEALLLHAQAIAQTTCLVLLVEMELGGRHALGQMLERASTGETRARQGAGEERAGRAHSSGGTPTVGEAIAIERFPERAEPPAAQPFAFTDALGRRDVGAALLAAHEQLRLGKEPLELLGLVAWQLNRWTRVRRLIDLDYDAERIASATDLRLWQAQRLRQEVAGRSLVSLQRLLERCWQLDVDAKSGRTIPALALEQLVTATCLLGAADY